MPIYEFDCPSCAHRFERLQKVADADPSECPQCGSSGVRRRLTAPAFRLAGSGWYETDFKKDGDKKRNLTEKGEGASGGSAASSEAKPSPKADSAKADTKPAAKAEAPAKPASGAS